VYLGFSFPRSQAERERYYDKIRGFNNKTLKAVCLDSWFSLLLPNKKNLFQKASPIQNMRRGLGRVQWTGQECQP